MMNTFTLEDKKQMLEYIDDFLYHMEDNFGMRMSANEQLKKWKLESICLKLNKIYGELAEMIKKEEN